MSRADTSRCLSSMQLDLHASGTLDDSEALAHLESCDRCRRELDEQRANNALLAQLSGSIRGGAPGASGADWLAGGDVHIAGFTLEREIHRGAQGVVYRAHQHSANRTVALKLLLSGAFATTEQRRRFEREIELVAGLDHPSIVTIYESGTTDGGQLYFAMQLIDGVPFDEWVDGILDERAGGSVRDRLRRALKLFARICDAVHHAHQRGVMHRDLKPANILVDAGGAPHVLDFGLARPIDTKDSQWLRTVTQDGQFMGTIAYASPEQLTGDISNVDVRSDVYALGVILYETISGTLLIPIGGDLRAALKAIAEMDPPPPSEHGARRLPINRDLDTIARKALAKSKHRRYQSAAELRDDIDHYLAGEPIDARRDSSWYVFRRTVAQHKAPVAVLVSAIVVLAGVAIAMSVLYQRARTEAEKVTQINLFLEDTLGSVEPMTPGEEITVREMLDEAAQWIEIALSDQPEIQASIHTTVGNGYRALGLFDKSEHHLEKSLSIRRDLFGWRDAQVAQSLNALGLLRQSEGDHDAAIGLFNEALAMRLDLLGENSYEVSLTHANLALASRETGALDAAEKHTQASLAIRRKLFGDEHADVAMCLFNLAVIAELRGDAEAAIDWYRQALDMRRNVLHHDHPDLARSQLALGRLLVQHDRAAEALPLLEEARNSRAQRLGDAHWHTAEAACAVAEAYAGLQRYDESAAELAPALVLLRSAFGPDDERTIRAAALLSKVQSLESASTDHQPGDARKPP